MIAVSATLGCLFARRYWIEPALAKRLTTRKTFQREPTAFENTMNVERLHRVLGATGVKTTVLTQQRADKTLIESQQRYQCLAHQLGNLCRKSEACSLRSSRERKDSGINASSGG